MKRITLALVIICILCMAGCSSDDEQYGYSLFYVSEACNELVAEGYNAGSASVKTLVDELIGKLENGPDSVDAVAPGFDDTKVISYDVTDEGYVILNFDAGYNSMPFIKETLCRAAIVKTLCQIEGVNGVEFLIEGRQHLDHAGSPYGYMTEETFVDNTSGGTTYKQKISVNLYFADSTGRKLVNVPANVTFDGTISIEQLIVQQLINGPESIKGVDKELKAAVPDTTAVNKITVLEQICYIDLSKDFLTSVEGVNKEVSLYSIVNALADRPNINKVQFSIDGSVLEYYGASSIVFDSPLERNLELIKE